MKLSRDQFLFDLMAQRLRPLRLQVDASGRVTGIDGDAAYYGYRELALGVSALDQFAFLHGFMEVAEDSIRLLETPNGKCADVLWKRMEEGGQLVLFDATEIYDQVRSSQQTANDSQILQYRLEQASELLQQNQQELLHLAYYDSLTGLHNRRKFYERLPEEVARARRSGAPLVLLLIDIDFFKRYNDHYGHLDGDQCLPWVAQEIQRHAHRPADLAARVGGEEFVLLLPDTELQSALLLAQNLCVAVQALSIPHLDSPFGCVTVSVGIAALDHESSDPSWEPLYRRADKALYAAKTKGRNCTAAAGLDSAS